MHSFSKKLLTLSLLIIGSFCLAPSLYSTPTTLISLSERDAGTPITIQKDQMISITLEENPTTGFSWSYAITPSPNDLELISDFSSLSMLEGYFAFGEPTFHTWIFKAKQPSAGISFNYKRGWENIPSLETVSFSFTPAL